MYTWFPQVCIIWWQNQVMKKVFLLVVLAYCLQPAQCKAQYENDSSHTVPPFKIFDNLYYVGTDFVSAYIVKTNNGLVLIDALYGKFTAHIFDAMKQLRLDPASIKYIICTHGHYDHMEGADTIKKVTHARIAMTDADWQIVEGKLPDDYKSQKSFPARDMVISDNDSLVIGGMKIRFYVTPGHTQGVLSMAFPVTDGGRSYKAFLFGGVGLNFNGVERTRQYLHSVERVIAMKDIEVNISNHPGPGNILERAKLLEKRKAGELHPFVAPVEFQAWMQQLHKKAEAKLVDEIQRSKK